MKLFQKYTLAVRLQELYPICVDLNPATLCLYMVVVSRINRKSLRRRFLQGMDLYDSSLRLSVCLSGPHKRSRKSQVAFRGD